MYGSAALAVLVASVFVDRLRADVSVETHPLDRPVPRAGTTSWRVVALKLPEVIGENVIVDNRPGAAGLVGTELAARAPADGYTGCWSIRRCRSTCRLQEPQHDAPKDFDPTTDVADTPSAAQQGSPYQSVRDVINAAKAQPGKINFGSGGNGSGSHLTGEFFQLRTGIKLTHIPYKGVGLALSDVIAGQIQTTFTSEPPAMGLIKSARIKALAVASEKRISSLPDVPTFGEQGVKDVVVVNWYGIASIGGTPKSVLDKLHAALLRVIAMPDVKERLRPVPRTCADVAAGISPAHRRRAPALGGSDEERRHQTRMRLANKQWLAIAMLLLARLGQPLLPEYPSKPIRLIVPYAPGGVADLLSRILAQRLGTLYSQQIIVENRPGSAGHIGAELTLKAPADGYTIMFATTTHNAAYAMYSKLAYDPAKDLQPVILVAEIQGVLVVHPSLPTRTVKEFVALAKARPGELNYGSAGAGSATHIAAELFKALAKVNLTHIPHKGSGPR
jgi:tripartite-type tricarboxylate transporter receptor subunit TctC